MTNVLILELESLKVEKAEKSGNGDFGCECKAKAYPANKSLRLYEFIPCSNCILTQLFRYSAFSSGALLVQRKNLHNQGNRSDL